MGLKIIYSNMYKEIGLHIDEKDDMRQQVSNIIKNCPKTQNLTSDELKTLKLLKKNETITIALQIKEESQYTR